LIDAEIEHWWFSCRVVGSKVSNFTLPPEGEPLLLNAAALSQIPTHFGGMAIRAEVLPTDARKYHGCQT
jgi:hypothetical protein